MNQHFIGKRRAFVVALCLGLLVVALGALTASADAVIVDFESFALGNINGQDGWSKTGGYDAAMVDQAGFSLSHPGFGSRSLRISNAVTSGSFGDQTFSKSTIDEAGETSAANGGKSGGTRQDYFEAEWDFASTVPGSEQAGLSVVASPDRGDGARMSWVQMADKPSGLEVNFYEYDQSADPGCATNGVAGFVLTNLVSGLDRTVPHTIKITMNFVDGADNDVVRVYVDGNLEVTGGSWEDYFRDCEGNPTRTVDSLLFRTSGAAAPATSGYGFVIDNLSQFTGAEPCTTVCYADAVGGDDANGGTSAADAKKTIQAAIDEVDAGGQVRVLPGSYSETAANRTVLASSPTPNGPHQFGLFFEGTAKDGVTLMGVTAADVEITDPALTEATITTNATNNFGSSGIFVEADNVTISGLEIGANTPGDNKTIEVIGDAFTFRNSYMNVAAGGSLYFGDWRFDTGTNTSYMLSYEIDNNIFSDGTSVDITSGAGYSGATADKKITNNQFEFTQAMYTASGNSSWPYVSFTGDSTTVPWFVYPMTGATITGNTFNNAAPNGIHIRARGIADDSTFDWESYWNDNTFNKAVIAGPNLFSDVRAYSYVSGAYTLNDVRQIGAVIQPEVDHAVNGDTVLVSAGTYLEQVNIYKSVELVGAGAATTFIKAPATMPIASNADSTIVKVTGASVSAEIHGFTIAGPGPSSCGSIQAGIFVRDGAYADIHDNTITDIRDTGDSGCQNGNAILIGRHSLGTTGTADITNNLIDNYQKNGITVTGVGSSANIDNNQVLGDGPIAYIAENGIQIGDGATAEITNNTVSGHSYPPFSYVATGIMLYQAGATNTDGNTVTGNQVGIYIYDTDGTHKNNDISATATDTGSPGFWGMIVDAPPPTHVPQPFEGDAIGALTTQGAPAITPNSAAPEQTVLVTGNNFTSDGSAGGVGLEADAGFGSYDIDLTMTKNLIHDWEYGIYVYECDPGVYTCSGTDFANVDINRNSIVGNTEYGMYASTLTPVTDGTCNWWGAASGPSEEGPGTGDKVGTDINFTPWLYTSDLDGPCFIGGTITVTKVAAGGGNTLFGFDPSWSTTNFSLTDGASSTSPMLQAGSYAVAEVTPLPTNWALQSATCDNTTTTQVVETAAPSAITLADGDAWACTFTNVYTPPPTNVCNVQDSSALWTDILGKGMGSPKKHKAQVKMSIPNYAQVDSLYGQMVARNSGNANYVRFILPGKNNYVQVNTITSPADHNAGNFWYGAYIDPAKLPAKTVTGRWFLQKTGTKNHIPRALVLYPTYRSTTNTWVNIWNTYGAAEGEVYWDTANGWTQERVIVESIAPPNGPTTFNVELAVADNDKDARPIWVTVEAGGVTQTQMPNNPSHADQLNLMTFTLANVPAGTDEITITIYSPSMAADGVVGDSAALVGMAANYMCSPLN